MIFSKESIINKTFILQKFYDSSKVTLLIFSILLIRLKNIKLLKGFMIW